MVNGQARRSDLDTDQPLYYRLNQKKAEYAQIAQSNGLSFVPAYRSSPPGSHGFNVPQSD